MCERSFSCSWNTQALVVIETLKITFSDDPGFLVFISICIMIIIPALSRHINRWSKFCVVGYSGAVIFTNFCHWLFTNQRIYNGSLHSVMLPFFLGMMRTVEVSFSLGLLAFLIYLIKVSAIVLNLYTLS